MTGSGSCQRWRAGVGSWRHLADGGFDARRFAAVPLASTAATQFVCRHHYAATAPACRLTYGLTTDDDSLASGAVIAGRHLVGVAILSVPMHPGVLTNVFPTLAPYTESLELGRFVLTDPVAANAESWFLARVFELARQAGIRGIVAFSDPMPRRVVRTGNHTGDVTDQLTGELTEFTVTPGHVGVIYQATNARYLGRSTARTLTYLPQHGIVLTERRLQKLRAGEPGADGVERHLVDLGARPRPAGLDRRVWLRHALADLQVTRVRHPGNHRYAWPIDPRRRRRSLPVALPSRPYPKAATGGIAPVQPTLDLPLDLTPGSTLEVK